MTNSNQSFWRNPKNKPWIYGLFIVIVITIGMSAFEEQTGTHRYSEHGVQKSIKQYAEDDFYWDKNTKPHKDVIMRGAHKVLKENDRCFDIDPGTVDVSMNRGTKDNPHFYIYCKDASGETFIAYWAKSDVTNNEKLAALKNIDHGQANKLCKEAVIKDANHPSTVDYSMLNAGFKDWPNGRTRVETTFKAKNSYGLEIKHNVSCLFEGGVIIDLQIKEAN